MANKRETLLKSWIGHLAKSGDFTVAVEWVKSRTWGRNPQVRDNNGESCLDISGCGYCKTSTAIANIAAQLPDLSDVERDNIARLGGTGADNTTKGIARFTGGRWACKLARGGNVDVLHFTRQEKKRNGWLFSSYTGQVLRPATLNERRASIEARNAARAKGRTPSPVYESEGVFETEIPGVYSALVLPLPPYKAPKAPPVESSES